ncbi:hypothetical protein [Qipengyuania atrilutea]|uniref:Uncharacterized protein n=1 Tax=Qipengyuania atrilutea TaxID=2744473 RepID=A0A850H2S4_9SPHN|nr:hypothetical protein [Actirhodobacter atriluteus]NVD44203.1 hypothetical protein [Actirhodobacter atriluteus]
MAEKSGRQRAFGCAILAAAIAIAAVTLTPIGPLFVYGWLVPIISPAIPKPESVPSRAGAQFHWKGFGLVWYWEDRLTNGCARWFAAEGPSGPVRGLDVFEGVAGCDGGERTISRLSFENHSIFGNGANDWPYEDCPFDLSSASIRKHLAHISSLKAANSGEIENRMLEEMQLEIEQIERVGLRAQQYGCRLGAG